jgi:hypothetical protein
MQYAVLRNGTVCCRSGQLQYLCDQCRGAVLHQNGSLVVADDGDRVPSPPSLVDAV